MAFSINTNNASMAALESLRMTNSELTSTQNEVSTGLAVSSAADNPAVYAIAQQMDGNISGLAAVSTSLSFGAQVVSTASQASENILTTLQTLQNSVTQAGQTGISTSTMQTPGRQCAEPDQHVRAQLDLQRHQPAHQCRRCRRLGHQHPALGRRRAAGQYAQHRQPGRRDHAGRNVADRRAGPDQRHGRGRDRARQRPLPAPAR